MSTRVAIIGTRQPTAELRSLCRNVAAAFRDLGCHLVTGNADGIDGIAVDIWNRLFPERVTLVLPWPNYNRHRIHPQNSVIVFRDQREWAESVVRYHPTGRHLSIGAFRLHARIYGIVEMADAVIAFPYDGRESGGTGQGIRIARQMGKPLFVLPGDLDALRKYYQRLRRELFESRRTPKSQQGVDSLGRAPSLGKNEAR